MSISIDSLNLNNIYNSQNNSSTNALENKLDQDFANATSDELMDVCREFESYFTEQMFKSMQKMVPESEEVSSSTKQLQDYFKDEMIKGYAEQSANGEGLGLAQMLYEQMKRNYNIE